jgi:hypothetical protein
MEFTVDLLGRNHLSGLFASLPAIAQLAMREQVEAYLDEGEELAIQYIEERTNPERSSGRWAASVKTRVTNEGDRIAGIIYFDGVPYGRIQDKGGQTSPHMIYPRRAKILAFMAASGQKVFARRVSHPGARIPAMNITRDVQRELGARMSRSIKKAIVNGIRQNMRRGANG